MSSIEVVTINSGLTPVSHVKADDVEWSGGRWDDLCERCTQIPLDRLARAETGTLPAEDIYLNRELNSETCRLCRLFAHTYAQTPAGPPSWLTPERRGPIYRFQHKLYRATLHSEGIDCGICWILTGRNPKDEEVAAE
jgi:hypothetical protein